MSVRILSYETAASLLSWTECQSQRKTRPTLPLRTPDIHTGPRREGQTERLLTQHAEPLLISRRLSACSAKRCALSARRAALILFSAKPFSAPATGKKLARRAALILFSAKPFSAPATGKTNSAQKTNKKGRTADPKFVRLVRRMHSQQARSTEIPRRFPHSKPSWPLGDTTKATRRHDSHHHPRYTRLARDCTLASHICLARGTLCVTLCSELELVVQVMSLKNSQWRLSDWPNKAARRIFGIPTKAATQFTARRKIERVGTPHSVDGRPRGTGLIALVLCMPNIVCAHIGERQIGATRPDPITLLCTTHEGTSTFPSTPSLHSAAATSSLCCFMRHDRGGFGRALESGLEFRTTLPRAEKQRAGVRKRRGIPGEYSRSNGRLPIAPICAQSKDVTASACTFTQPALPVGAALLVMAVSCHSLKRIVGRNVAPGVSQSQMCIFHCHVRHSGCGECGEDAHAQDGSFDTSPVCQPPPGPPVLHTKLQVRGKKGSRTEHWSTWLPSHFVVVSTCRLCRRNETHHRALWGPNASSELSWHPRRLYKPPLRNPC
ncbi:hypothetical protein L1887_61960 [Cichorium endivia]|nr:hypothetical protein L1887_61960 [Cichorium endivia]